MTEAARPVTVLVCALGGEGGGVLAEWLYAAAVRAGHSAQATSIPGVAQRTGATTYYLEIHPQPDSTLDGRRPVFSLSPVPGEIDLLVSSELLETTRQIGSGMSSPDRTRLISSSARVLTTTEKMALGDGRLDDAVLVAALARQVRDARLIDMAGLAREAGAALSAVMYGAIAGSGVLPWPSEVDEATLRASSKGGEASMRGFARGLDAVRRAPAEIIGRMRGERPADVPDLRRIARERLVGYQDEAYARLFDDRLARVAEAEAASRPAKSHAGAVEREVTRWLALWMAFDDIVHVAGLKLAGSRQQRVRREVGAGDSELVKVFDHFKPGVNEVAGLLPSALAGRLQAWDRRRVRQGRPSWSVPVRLGSHTVSGALALRLLSGLRGWRRRGSRFAVEQALIERWLAAIERGVREDHALGLEIAMCGRLVKGYGSTNERSKDRLLHIIDHVAFGEQPVEARAGSVRTVREAALADDAGRHFDDALSSLGAPARPLREQPIRWFKRRPGAA